MKDSIINFMVLLIGFSFLCCNQISDTKIEKSVKEYMKTEVNDPSKYEPLSFEVDTVYLRYQDTEEFNILKGLFDVATDKSFRAYQHVSNLRKLNNSAFQFYLDSAIIVHETCREMCNKMSDYIKSKSVSFDSTEYSKRITEYKVLHKFRATNSEGVLINTSYLFFVDSTFKIVDVIENPNPESVAIEDLHKSEVNSNANRFNLP